MTLDITNRKPLGPEIIRTESLDTGAEYCVQLSKYDIVISEHLPLPFTAALPMSFKQRSKEQIEEILKMSRKKFCIWCKDQLYY